MSDKKETTTPAAGENLSKGDQVALLKGIKLKSIEGFADSKPVYVPAGQIKALGGKVEPGTPDERPVKITAGDLKKLCN